MKEESKKQQQVAALIQKEFSHVLRMEGSYIYGTEPLVTVTRVRMSHDLGIAYIYVSVFNALYKQEIVKELWENLQRLRGELGRRIANQVRRVPMLKFFLDDTLDQVEHVDRLFEQLNTSTNSTRSMKEALEARAAAQAQSEESDESGQDA